MPIPPLCNHREAVLDYHPHISKPWERRCESCHLNAYGTTIQDVDSVFHLLAERRHIEGVAARRKAGEVFSHAEERSWGYNPYGSGKDHNF